MFAIDTSVGVLIDVQGKLASLMHDREALYENLSRLLRGLRALDVPLLWTEQLPDKLGATVEVLQPHLAGLVPLPKASFSCWGDAGFRRALEATGRQQVILAGIEAHVCVFQTAAHLADAGYTVQVVADAVSARTEANRRLGLDRIGRRGIELTSVEALLFELMQTAEHPAFRDVIRAIK